MPRKKASVRWCSSGNDRRRLRHFAFSLPCFRFLSPTFALFASFLFSLSRLSFFPLPSFARFFRLSFPLLPSFARFFRLSFPLLPSFARSTPFRILFPGFSLSPPVFTASAPRFLSFRPYFFGTHPYFCRLLSSFHCSKNTFRQSGGRSRTEIPDSTPFSA